MNNIKLNELLKLNENELLAELSSLSKSERNEVQQFFMKKGKINVFMSINSKIQGEKHSKGLIDNLTEQSNVLKNELEIFKIKPNPHQVRNDFTNEQVSDLANSISERGLITPITVYKNKEGEYILIAGQLRLEAYKKLNKEKGDKYLKINVFVKADSSEYGEVDFIIDSLTENTARNNMFILDLALSIKRTFDLLKDKDENITLDKIGKTIGRTKGYVSKYLKIYDLIEDNKEIFDYLREVGEISSQRLYTNMAELKGNYEEKKRIVDKYVSKEITLEQIENIIKNQDRERTVKEKPKLSMYEEALEKGVFSFKKKFSIEKLEKLDEMKKADVYSKMSEIQKLQESIIKILN